MCGGMLYMHPPVVMVLNVIVTDMTAIVVVVDVALCRAGREEERTWPDSR